MEWLGLIGCGGCGDEILTTGSKRRQVRVANRLRMRKDLCGLDIVRVQIDPEVTVKYIQDCTVNNTRALGIRHLVEAGRELPIQMPELLKDGC